MSVKCFICDKDQACAPYCHCCDVDYCESCYAEEIKKEPNRKSAYTDEKGKLIEASCYMGCSDKCLIICSNCCL